MAVARSTGMRFAPGGTGAAARLRTAPRITATPAQTNAAWQAVARALTPPPPAAAPAPTPAPYTPPPLPTDVNFEAAIQDVINQRNALRGIYDPRRRAAAVDAARSLTDAGYFDVANDYAAGGNDQGSVYGVSGRGEGQATRDAVTGVLASYGSRGVHGSTASSRDQEFSRQRIINAREAVLRQLQNNQQESVNQQAADFTRLSGEERNLRGQYRDWQAGQQVPPPPVNPEVPAPNEAASQRPRMWVGANRPNLGPGWTVTRRGPNAPRNQRWVARRTS